MTIYLVRRHDGTYRGTGRIKWTSDMQRARVYTKPGPPKAYITSWKRQHPDEPTGQILAFTLSPEHATVFDMTESTAKSLQGKARRELVRSQEQATQQIQYLQQQREAIDRQLASLRS